MRSPRGRLLIAIATFCVSLPLLWTIPASALATTKRDIVGLIDKSSSAAYTAGVPFATSTPAEVAPYAAAFSGIVVNQSWAQLEPAAGHFSYRSLDASLAAVQNYNKAHATHPLAVRLRIFAAFAAPAWAKRIGGTPIVVPAAHQVGGAGTDGRWWSVRYRAAWSTFQHALAARYDASPLIRSVAVTSCTSLTGEPFVITGNQGVQAAITAAGWTGTAQRRCYDGAFADYSGWRRTPIEYAVNQGQTLAPNGRRLTKDVAISDEVLRRCASLQATSGRACVIANHALDVNAATTGRGASVYAEIDRLAAERHGRLSVAFQTNSPNAFGGCAGVAVAVAHHAHSLELWPSSAAFKGFQGFPTATLRTWASALTTGSGPSC